MSLRFLKITRRAQRGSSNTLEVLKNHAQGAQENKPKKRLCFLISKTRINFYFNALRYKNFYPKYFVCKLIIIIITYTCL